MLSYFDFIVKQSYYKINFYGNSMNEKFSPIENKPDGITARELAVVDSLNQEQIETLRKLKVKNLADQKK